MSFAWAGVQQLLSSSPGGTRLSSWTFCAPPDVLGDSNLDLQRTSASCNYAHDQAAVVPPISDEVSAKKKKKKKKKLPSAEEVSRGIEEQTPKISWGPVEEILFTRDIAYDGVPSIGGYPLGLGQEESRQLWSADEFQSVQQANLILRAHTLGIEILSPPQSQPQQQLGGYNQISPLETRQYDYKSGLKNPLFQSISEDIRIHLLSPNGKSRPRSDSMFERDVIDLCREIKQIRATRDQTGCSCKPVKVDKLSTGKIKSELKSQGHLINLSSEIVETLSKTELSLKMKELLKHCHMCVASNCECVAQGIGCFAEVCGCIGKRGTHSQVCANEYGQEAFDPDAVNEYRSKILDSQRKFVL